MQFLRNSEQTCSSNQDPMIYFLHLCPGTIRKTMSIISLGLEKAILGYSSSVCLSVCLSVCQSVCLSVCLFVYLPKTCHLKKCPGKLAVRSEKHVLLVFGRRLDFSYTPEDKTCQEKLALLSAKNQPSSAGHMNRKNKKRMLYLSKVTFWEHF